MMHVPCIDKGCEGSAAEPRSRPAPHLPVRGGNSTVSAAAHGSTAACIGCMSANRSRGRDDALSSLVVGFEGWVVLSSTYTCCLVGLRRAALCAALHLCPALCTQHVCLCHPCVLSSLGTGFNHHGHGVGLPLSIRLSHFSTPDALHSSGLERTGYIPQALAVPQRCSTTAAGCVHAASVCYDTCEAFACPFRMSLATSILSHVSSHMYFAMCLCSLVCAQPYSMCRCIHSHMCILHDVPQVESS
jgi:hypothetical protein